MKLVIRLFLILRSNLYYEVTIYFNAFSGCYQAHQPLVGDGICDDESNHIDCGFDGGDCCLHSVVTEFCSECQCLNWPLFTGYKGLLSEIY